MKSFVKTDSGSSHLSVVIDFGGCGSANQVNLKSFQIHLSGAATASNTLTVTRRSKRGSAFDSVIFTQAMVSQADVVWRPDPPASLNGKDRVDISWTNDAASFKTWGIEAEFEG